MMTTLLTILISTYPWPIRPFGSVHQVSGTLGDARGSVVAPRFHWGIDIPASVGTDVFSVDSDTAVVQAAGVNSWVRVGDYRYMHITPLVATGDSVLGIQDTVNTPPTQIGDVLDYTNGDHLHFEIGPSGGPFVNPLSYNGGPVNYSDNGLPNVFSNSTTHWWFWRQGSEGPTAQQLVDVLDGKVDIRAYCQDIQTSGGVNNTSGIYKLQYIIADTLHNTIYNSDTTIVFRQVQPPNNGDPVLLVYDRHNYRTASPFYYWVTNRIVNNQVVDRYWNTKQKADSAGIPFPDSVDADSIENAKFKDGRYWVKVMAYDIRNNVDRESVLVHVDNFNPRVKETYPISWFAFVPTKEKRIWCRFSEPMDTLTLNTANIKIRSLKADSFNYPITSILFPNV